MENLLLLLVLFASLLFCEENLFLHGGILLKMNPKDVGTIAIWIIQDHLLIMGNDVFTYSSFINFREFHSKAFASINKQTIHIRIKLLFSSLCLLKSFCYDLVKLTRMEWAILCVAVCVRLKFSLPRAFSSANN